MQQYFISYTLSHPTTYNLVACFVDVEFHLPQDTDPYEHLKLLYPMFTVYIENIA